MIAEPYIAIKGPRAGEIGWFDDSDGFNCSSEEPWQPYADFEREKLTGLCDKNCDMMAVGLSLRMGYFLGFDDDSGMHEIISSDELIDYCGCKYLKDSESSRLLKRAEFLKAVCEKENVPWLDSIAWCHCKNPRKDGMHQIQGQCEHEGYVDSKGFCRKCWDAGKGCASCDNEKCPSNRDFCECPKPGEGDFRCYTHPRMKDVYTKEEALKAFAGSGKFFDFAVGVRTFQELLLDALSEEATKPRLEGQKFRAQWTEELRKRFHGRHI
jgi:hypothetical protein